MAKLSADDLLTRKLRAAFDTVPLDPLPPEFLDLLAQLDGKEVWREAVQVGVDRIRSDSARHH